MGGVGPVAFWGFLGGTCVCVLMGGTGSLLSGLQSSAGNEFGDVCGFCMALGSPSFNVQGCVTVFLEN